MVRKNDKKEVIDYNNSIKKSNELSMAKMNQGLSLNQMQLFAYAIFSTQKDGKTEFRKHEFEKKFNINQLRPNDAMDDAYSLLDLKIELRDEKKEKSSGYNVFTYYEYNKGEFVFNWNEVFLPHISELKEKYVISDLTIMSQFKSGFSWILYEFMKSQYGNWYKELSKVELMNLFNVENRKSYQTSTAEFKRSVLDVAISEINKHTELETWYTEKKIGNKITGFILHWSTGNQLPGATTKQVKLLQEVHDEVDKNILDYLQVNKSDLAKQHIIRIKTINEHVKKGLSISEADGYIRESLEVYKQLEHLLKNNGKQRDTSIYYNWLEEIED